MEETHEYTYSVGYDKEQWIIGDSLLEIIEKADIVIKGIRNMGTLGLYDLLFVTKPDRDVDAD